MLKAAARKTLRQSQIDPALAGVREADGLATRPADERDAWRQFWGEVAKALTAKTK
jgi:hypothetical protein